MSDRVAYILWGCWFVNIPVSWALLGAYYLYATRSWVRRHERGRLSKEQGDFVCALHLVWFLWVVMFSLLLVGADFIWTGIR